MSATPTPSEVGSPRPSAPTPVVMRQRRARFSLRSLLLLTALAAATIVIARLYSELAPLRAEVRRLRDELGQLSIDDPAKLHAIAAPVDNELTWKWRLWIPEGRRYRLHIVGDKIPKKGFPAQTSWLSVDEPGEQWVEYRIRRDRKTGAWMGKLRARTASVGSAQQDWVQWASSVSTGEGVYATTVVFEAGRRAVLARHRVSQSVRSSTQIEDPSAGFLIWLEPVP